MKKSSLSSIISTNKCAELALGNVLRKKQHNIKKLKKKEKQQTTGPYV